MYMKTKVATGIFSEEEKEGISVSENFGLLLRHYRKLRNYTLKELEEISGGVSAGYINRLENGERNPSIKKILQLSQALRIPKSTLIETLIRTPEVNEESLSLSELLIRNNYFVGSRALSIGAKQLLIQIIEHITEAEWSVTSKIREMYELSEIIDQLKSEMNK